MCSTHLRRRRGTAPAPKHSAVSKKDDSDFTASSPTDFGTARLRGSLEEELKLLRNRGCIWNTELSPCDRQIAYAAIDRPTVASDHCRSEGASSLVQTFLHDAYPRRIGPR